MSSSRRDRAELRRLLAARAVPLDLRDDGSLAPFAALDPLAGEARVAYVVESHHFIHEKYAFRLLLLRYLATRGWRWIGEELGWSDCVAIDTYMGSGEEAALHRVPTYGYEDVRRSDREDRPWGILAAGDAVYPEAALAFEQRAFARAARAQLGNVRWFGFDVDGWATAAYEPLLARDLPDDLRAGLAQVPGESLTDEAERVARAVRAVEPELDDARVVRLLDALESTLRYAAEAYPATTWDGLRPAMARREALMHRHVDAVLDAPTLAHGERVALLAGSLHLVKDDALVSARSDGVGPGGDRHASIGHHVAHRPDLGPDRVLSVWMLCGSGRDSNPMATGEQRIEPGRDTINSALAEVAAGQALFVPTAGIEQEVVVQHMYNAVFTTPLAAQLDAIVFAPEVTPLHAPRDPDDPERLLA